MAGARAPSDGTGSPGDAGALRAPTSAGAALAEAAATLRAAGCDAPRLDAELLLGAVTGADRAALLAHPERPLTADEAGRFAALVARRAAREPLAYILGRKGFRHLELAVDARVLIPRPETETLVEAALALPKRARVLDVGTGSGAVALALAAERPDLEVVAADDSPEALAVAAANARRLGLDVAVVRSDLLAATGDRFDAIVSNPPYVADGEIETLAPEIREHEPLGALRGGPDGLDVIRRLVRDAAAVPFLALEIGAGQAPAVAELMRAAGRDRVQARRDLAGIERVVVGLRP